MRFSSGVRIYTDDGSESNGRELDLPVGPIAPLATVRRSFFVETKSSGRLGVSFKLQGDRTEMQGPAPSEMNMEIHPRPIPVTPQIPADIVSYLGDRAIEECQKIHPCAQKSPLGGCMRYPDSEESRRCLAERNIELFSGCELRYRQGEDLTDWYICLMKRHGFEVRVPE